MPIYLYRCVTCKHEFKENHSMSDKITYCESCESEDTLVRLPSHFAHFRKQEKEPKVGTLVKEYIESNRADLKEEKARLSREEYNK